jgi:hypothetical protein
MITKDAVHQLESARERAAEAKARIKEIEDRYPAFRELKEASEDVKAAEEVLRRQARIAYRENHQKTQAFGIGVRVKTSSRLVYDDAAAMTYAQENPSLGLLTFDREAFEAIAVVRKPDFVEVEVSNTVVPTLPKRFTDE